MAEGIESAPAGSAVHDVSVVPVSMVMGAGSHFDSESEDALAMRYGKLKKKTENVVYEFTREPELLHQYYLIREEMYQRVLGLRFFSGKEDECDKRSHVLVARKGNQIIGGVRITTRTPRQPRSLPMESSNFNLESALSEMHLQEKHYGEMSRMALLPEFHGGDAMFQMFSHIYRKANALNLDVLFGAAPLLNARAYKQNSAALGVNVKIHFDVKLPSYPIHEGIKMYLVSAVKKDVSVLKEASHPQAEKETTREASIRQKVNG